MGFITGLFVKKNIKWLVLAIVIVGIIAGGYFAVKSYNKAIEEAANLERDNAQLEQNIQDKDNYIEMMTELQEASNEIMRNTQAQNTTIIERHSEVRGYLDSKVARDQDGDAPEVIKETIRMLANEE